VSPLSSGSVRIGHTAQPNRENNQEQGLTEIYMGQPRLAPKSGSSSLQPICESTDGGHKGKKNFSDAEGEISKCQELDGKNLSKKKD